MIPVILKANYEDLSKRKLLKKYPNKRKQAVLKNIQADFKRKFNNPIFEYGVNDDNIIMTNGETGIAANNTWKFKKNKQSLLVRSQRNYRKSLIKKSEMKVTWLA